MFLYTFLHRPLTPEQKAMHNAVVMFSVKDKDLFGYSNQYIAECYLIFQNIPHDGSDQIHLKLSRPTVTCKVFFNNLLR